MVVHGNIHSIAFSLADLLEMWLWFALQLIFSHQIMKWVVATQNVLYRVLYKTVSPKATFLHWIGQSNQEMQPVLILAVKMVSIKKSKFYRLQLPNCISHGDIMGSIFIQWHTAIVLRISLFMRSTTCLLWAGQLFSTLLFHSILVTLFRTRIYHTQPPWYHTTLFIRVCLSFHIYFVFFQPDVW